MVNREAPGTARHRESSRLRGSLRRAEVWLRRHPTTADALSCADGRPCPGRRNLGEFDLRPLENRLDGFVFCRTLTATFHHQRVSDRPVGTQPGLEVPHRRAIPTGVHNSQLTEIEPQWNRSEPADVLAVPLGVLVNLCQELLVLLALARGKSPEELEFCVSTDGLRLSF